MNHQIDKRCPQKRPWTNITYGVAVVIGTDFRNLEALASTTHVWVPRISPYETIVAGIRQGQPQYSNESGVTDYHYEPGETPEETFMSLLETVDLHHGEFSHDPPWQFMEVHGLQLTDDVKVALEVYGVIDYRVLPDGFVALRGF